MNKQSGKVFAEAIREAFKACTGELPTFKDGQNIKGITADFSDAEAKGFRKFLGEEVANKLLGAAR